MTTTRTPVEITFSVWNALFLRELVSRLSAYRGAWLWLLLEPIVHIVFLMFIMVVIRLRVVGGIDTSIWIMIGLLAFFMFKQTSSQSTSVIGKNQALFGYRQVKPVDTVLVRAGLEGMLVVLLALILFGGAALFGLDVVPADPLVVLEAFFGLWLVGLGFALITSVISELVPDLGRFINMINAPLYFFSGVIFPIARIPPPHRDWLMLNPVAHGIEAARLGFAPYYQAVPETSMVYMYACAVVGILLGLALHQHFAAKLIAR